MTPKCERCYTDMLDAGSGIGFYCPVKGCVPNAWEREQSASKQRRRALMQQIITQPDSIADLIISLMERVMVLEFNSPASDWPISHGHRIEEELRSRAAKET